VELGFHCVTVFASYTEHFLKDTRSYSFQLWILLPLHSPQWSDVQLF